MKERLIVTMSDGSRWSIPVALIAEDRAKQYAHEFDGDIVRSLNEDTVPLFTSDEFEIIDWAQNNMNWHDVRESARRLDAKVEPDYQEGWVNGPKELV